MQATTTPRLVTLPALPEAGLNLAQVLLLAEAPAQVQQELAALSAPDAHARREKASLPRA